MYNSKWCTKIATQMEMHHLRGGRELEICRLAPCCSGLYLTQLPIDWTYATDLFLEDRNQILFTALSS